MTGLELTLLLLLAAVSGVVLFRYLNLPPILGYLTAGVLIGPHALGWIPASREGMHLAEFGVVFLMFSIGLEFSLPKLNAMRTIVFGLGLAQVGLTIVFTQMAALLLHWFAPAYGVSWQTALILGGALAMSSTAVASKLLTERLEIDSAHGRQIIGVLLFQDLAVVPLLIIAPALSAGPNVMLAHLSVALLKAILVLAFLLVLGQRLMRRWLHIVAARRSHELFMLNLLLMTLGLAWVTEVAGLSLALGAFLAGMLIAEPEYKIQVEEDIKPFRHVLLGLFFITIGMQLDLHIVGEHLGWVLLLLTIPVLFKFGLIVLLARLLHAPVGVAVRAGLYLAPAGEFAFVILNQAADLQLVSPLMVQAILASMVLSMLAAPFLIQYSDRIVLRLSAQEWMLQSLALHKIATQAVATEKHVVICGYGRSGQHLARLLEQENIPYIALDLDPDRVREATAAGESVVYGDAARREALAAAGLNRAAALVVTYANTPSAMRVLHHVSQLAPQVPVIVRTHDDNDLDKLLKAGATEVVPEIIEGSLMLASHALLLLGVPINRVVRQVRETREARYGLLRGFFHGADDMGHDALDQESVRLHSINLPAGAAAVGRTLGEIDLAEVMVEVTSLRRHDMRGRTPNLDTLLQTGDTLVLRGTAEALALAEQRLL